MNRSKRDVMFHAAVTIVPRSNGVHLVGQKDVEICQYAAEIHAKKTPIPEHHVRRAFAEMTARCIHDLRAAGLMKESK